MHQLQRFRGQLLLLLLSLVGVGISIYLTAVHYENVPLVCSASGIVDCARVLSSPFSVIPGTTIPISVPGLGWCLAFAVLSAIGWRSVSLQRSVRIAQFLLALVGMVTVLYLVYVELVRLHTICAWCTALHVIILIVFLMTLAQLQQPHDEPEPTSADEQRTLTSARNRQ